MKTILFVLAGTILTSFVNKPVDKSDLEGYWMGYYMTDASKEKVIIKLDTDNDRMEFYTGGIDDSKKVDGSYKIYDDSVVLNYQAASGEKILMQGHYNPRRNFIDGVCRINNQASGSFYLEKQELEERMVEP